MDATGALLGVWTPPGLQDFQTGNGTKRAFARAVDPAIVIVVCWRRQQFISLLGMLPKSGGRFNVGLNLVWTEPVTGLEGYSVLVQPEMREGDLR